MYRILEDMNSYFHNSRNNLPHNIFSANGQNSALLPEESGRDKRAPACLWRDVLWAIWGSSSENSGSKVIKTAPEELKEKYRQMFA